jgi:hypothetical protein
MIEKKWMDAIFCAYDRRDGRTIQVSEAFFIRVFIPFRSIEPS